MNIPTHDEVTKAGIQKEDSMFIIVLLNNKKMQPKVECRSNTRVIITTNYAVDARRDVVLVIALVFE